MGGLERMDQKRGGEKEESHGRTRGVISLLCISMAGSRKADFRNYT